MSLQDNSRNAKEIWKLLKKEYPEKKTALEYKKTHQLLIAVILSAQCTDARVNMVTPALFDRYKTVQEFAQANSKELENLIHSTGFYHNKAKNIIGCCKALLVKYNGKVPDTMEELIQLPGVGRKTANVVLGDAFGKIEGIVVDTHVMRLSQRLGFSQNDDAVKIEKDLMPLIPKKDWFHLSHALISHGRKICHARRPLCEQCVVNHLCPSAKLWMSIEKKH
ncbi:MAG: endonuclease III [Bacteroidetes bacterium]|nr:endonuclease III [Bacteroidota bacterium]